MATSLSHRGVRNAYVTITDDDTEILVDAVSGYRIVVLSVAVNFAATPDTLTFSSDPDPGGTPDPTAVYGPFLGDGSATLCLPESQRGYFATVAGEALVATTGGSASGSTVVAVTYELAR